MKETVVVIFDSAVTISILGQCLGIKNKKLYAHWIISTIETFLKHSSRWEDVCSSEWNGSKQLNSNGSTCGIKWGGKYTGSQGQVIDNNKTTLTAYFSGCISMQQKNSGQVTQCLHLHRCNTMQDENAEVWTVPNVLMIATVIFIRILNMIMNYLIVFILQVSSRALTCKA